MMPATLDAGVSTASRTGLVVLAWLGLAGQGARRALHRCRSLPSRQSNLAGRLLAAARHRSVQADTTQLEVIR